MSGVISSGGAIDNSCTAALWPQTGDIHFQLTSQTGAQITEENFRGRKTLIFFGFTHCPDACPPAMAKLGSMTAMLPKGEPAPHVLFVSVDPKRDTPEARWHDEQYEPVLDAILKGRVRGRTVVRVGGSA